MYLSKISFDHERHWKTMLKTLNQSVYEEHQMIWRFFPEGPQTERPFLYRREDSGDIPFYYLLSEQAPRVEAPGFLCQTRPFNPALKPGDYLQFSLRANAVKSYPSEEGSKRKKRQDIVLSRKDRYELEERPPLEHIRYEAGWEWLASQGREKGFMVKSLSVENHTVQSLAKDKSIKKQIFACMDFAGIVCVEEVTRFEKVLFSGLGRSKAFGCGLFLIRRA